MSRLSESNGASNGAKTPHVVIIGAGPAGLTAAYELVERYGITSTILESDSVVGGIKQIALDKLLKEHPERVIEFAVKGMLPKGPLGYAMLKKLKIYAGASHPHAAQQPRQLEVRA